MIEIRKIMTQRKEELLRESEEKLTLKELRDKIKTRNRTYFLRV